MARVVTELKMQGKIPRGRPSLGWLDKRTVNGEGCNRVKDARKDTKRKTKFRVAR